MLNNRPCEFVSELTPLIAVHGPKAEGPLLSLRANSGRSTDCLEVSERADADIRCVSKIALFAIDTRRCSIGDVAVVSQSSVGSQQIASGSLGARRWIDETHEVIALLKTGKAEAIACLLDRHRTNSLRGVTFLRDK